MMIKSVLCSIAPLLLVFCNLKCTFGLVPLFGRMTKQKPWTFTSTVLQGSQDGDSSSSSSSWSVTDDWEKLSSEHPTNAIPDSGDIFNTDIATQAAQAIESSSEGNKDFQVVSEEDVLINEGVDIVHNHGMFYEEGDPALYDTSFEEYTKTITFENDMGDEISMLVRCNEFPEEKRFYLYL